MWNVTREETETCLKRKKMYLYNLSRFLAFLSAAGHTGERNSVRLGDIFLPL